MAEQKEKKMEKVVAEPKQKKGRPDEHYAETLVRIYGKDIPGEKPVYVGLTYIKGISWAVSNAICHILNFNKRMKISEMTKEQVDKLESFLQKPQLYNQEIQNTYLQMNLIW
jgi:ribosomal protein S13